MVHTKKTMVLSRWVWSFASKVACAGALAFGITSCGGDDAPVAFPITTSYSVALSGDQENPPTSTGGTGVGTFTLVMPSGAISGGFTLNGITATAAHIHQADAGSNGAVIVPMTESPAGSGSWIIPSGTTLTAAQAAAVAAGGLYFNAHTAANPGGDIRGQIGRDVFGVQLAPGQEVPSNASAASGIGLLVFDPLLKKITARVTTTGMTATAAHIHTSVAGTNGGVTFPLTETAAGSGIWAAAADTSLTDAQITALNSGGMYFNVHSAAFPGGQVRGQIGLNVRTASLSGSQENPPTASSASGTGRLVVDPVTRAATGTVSFTGMTATAAHIHIGAAGTNGPVIVPLTAGGAGVFNLPAGATLSADQFRAYKQGELYFNIHSTANPSGEIRGQIR